MNHTGTELLKLTATLNLPEVAAKQNFTYEMLSFYVLSFELML